MGVGSHKEGNRAGQHGAHYPHAKADGSPEKAEVWNLVTIHYLFLWKSFGFEVSTVVMSQSSQKWLLLWKRGNACESSNLNMPPGMWWCCGLDIAYPHAVAHNYRVMMTINSVNPDVWGFDSISLVICCTDLAFPLSMCANWWVAWEWGAYFSLILEVL